LGKADIPLRLTNVRFWGKADIDQLATRLSDTLEKAIFTFA
jgi:hypothetical protein